MSFQFVVQRDPDGTWSVRERATNAPVVTGEKRPLSGLSEKEAVLHGRRLNRAQPLVALESSHVNSFG